MGRPRKKKALPKPRSGVTAVSDQASAPWAAWGFRLAVASGFLAMFSGLGSRWGFWHFERGFQLLATASYLGTAAAVLCLSGFVLAIWGKQRRGFLEAVVGLLVCVLVVGIPLSWKIAAGRLPKIHDITTDFSQVPDFNVVDPSFRKGAENPIEYGGIEVAREQKKAYPGVQPMPVDLPPDELFQACVRTARRLGWDSVPGGNSALSFVATDTSRWFGFKDDIVVRVTPLGKGGRVDVRSLSRVGLGDVGTNARRIKKFFAALMKELALMKAEKG